MTPVNPTLSRRTLLAGTAAAAAMMSMRDAIAQSSAGSWLAMVKVHHAMVMKTLDQMLDANDRTFLRRERLHQLLHYQLSAHSVAEENVLYPAIARTLQMSEADKLYLDQAHAKVMDAELAMLAAQQETEWFDKVRALKAALQQHANGDEEGRLYPELQGKLDAAANRRLTMAYQAEFSTVSKRRRLA
jgi:hemerythrin superfamily protein